MSLQKPLVSVCIPNFNNGPYLAQAIESVLCQTVTDLEVIVCDNQSTDNSIDVARSFIDPRVHVYSNERNLGIYGNFAQTTKLACGKFLKFLCADDWIDPDYLEVTLAYFDRYPEVGLVTTRQTSITNEGVILTHRREAMEGKDLYFPEEFLNGILWRINPIGNPTRVIVRREMYEAVGGFDPSNEFAGDLDLWLRIAAKFPIVAVPKIHCYERVHESQNTNLHVKNATDIRDNCLVFKKSFQDLPNFWTLKRRGALCRHGLSPYVRSAIRSRLKGERHYWDSVMIYMAELCPYRYWLPYNMLMFPWMEGKVYLNKIIRKLKQN